jgi:hypothetical protein
MKSIIFLFCVLAIFSCKNKQQEKPPPATVVTTKPDTVTFFPVTDFIRNQVIAVDSMPYAIQQLREINGRIDSAFVQKDFFKQMALNFIQPDFNSAELKKYYKENTFFDATINKVTFTYSTANPEMEIRQVIVYVDKENGDKVTSIYMEKQLSGGDSLVQKKMIWKMNKSFSILSIKQKSGQPEERVNMKLSWNE